MTRLGRGSVLANALVSTLLAGVLGGSVSAAPPPSPKPPPDPSAYENALRLARALHDDRTVASLLVGGAQNPELTTPQLVEIISSLEAIGDPERAARLLEDRMRRLPKDTASVEQLARLRDRMGDPQAAAAAWGELGKRRGAAGLTIAETDAYARAVAHLGRHDDALGLLRAAIDRAKPEDQDFWEDIATLAWELDDAAVALRALRIVYEQRYPLPGGSAGEKLMELEAEHGDPNKAVKIALAEYAALGEPATLLFAADVQSRLLDWEGVTRTLALGRERRAAFERREEYWLLLAEAREKLGDAAQALDAYRSALRINPSSSSARAALLWDAIDRDDLKKVGELLVRFGDTDDPELWDAYAVGWHRLGRAPRAVSYFLRKLRSKGSDEPIFLLEFADALDESGQPVLGARIRRTALRRLAPVMLAAIRKTMKHGALSQDEADTLRAAIDAHPDAAGAHWISRWLERYLLSRAAAPDKGALRADLAIDSEDPEAAAAVLRAQGRRGKQRRMALALVAEDRGVIRDLLETASASQLTDAGLVLERDDLVTAGLRRRLDHPLDEDEGEARRELDALRLRHAPRLGAAGNFEILANGELSGVTPRTSLHIVGVDVAAEHDVGRFRLIARAEPRQITGDLAEVRTRGTDELAADLTGRFIDLHGVTELRVGAIARDTSIVPRDDAPVAGSILGALPRGGVFYERTALGDHLAYGFELQASSIIEDTPFLRVAGLRHQLHLTTHAESALFYADLGADSAVDTTRRGEHLANQIAGTVEAGVRVLREHPEIELGVEAAGVGRDNDRSNLGAADVKPLLPAAFLGATSTLQNLMPQSYGSFVLVARLTRGDLSERSRIEAGEFPRYECEGSAGLTVTSSPSPAHPKRRTATAGAPLLTTPLAAVDCKASVRILHQGWVSASTRYEHGFAGLASGDLFAVSLSYTHLF